MFGRSFKLFTIFGFDIKLDWSWFIIAVLITWSLAAGLFNNQQMYPGLADEPALRWVMGAAGALGLFASIVLHELGHALAARRHGLPMRGITLFIFGGVAEMADEPQTPRVEFIMAIAGPIVSILLAGLFLGLAALPLPMPVRAVVGWLGLINFILVVFNMVPAFPLDGGRVLRSALWAWKKNLRWATRITSVIGSGFGIVLILFGVFRFLIGDPIGGLWMGLIGLFLHHAARMSYQQMLIRGALAGEPVQRFMRTNPHTVPADVTLDHLVNDYVYRYHHKMFPVVRNKDDLVGCVSTQELKQVPREQWPAETVEHITRPCDAENTVAPADDAMEALSKMNRTGRSRLLVVDRDHHLAGIITLKDLMRFLSLKLELDDQPGGGHVQPG